ncbi:MFS general substrate transporter [Xylariaceae sp. FL1651]|nr:MFS general substrate transporter [Xylariaceae sp. FL1651]
MAATNPSEEALEAVEPEPQAITKRFARPSSSADLEQGKTNDENEEISGWSFYVLIVVIIMAALVIALNGTVLGTAIPSITAEFKTVDDVGWYAAAYLVTTCVMSPLVGRLCKGFAPKAVFVWFVAIFEVGSLIAALAPSSSVLVLARGISGVGGSGIVNGAQAIIAEAVPIERRSFLNGVILGCLALGQAIGPLIGGCLTRALSWRWCFWMNLPLGGLVLFIMIFILRVPMISRYKTRRSLVRRISDIDWVGFFIFAISCVLFLLGLQGGTKTSPWNSPNVIGPLVGGMVGFAGLTGWFVYKGDAALIPLKMLTSRINCTIAITSFVQTGCFVPAHYWLPVWFQTVRQQDPVHSGILLLPLTLSQLVGCLLGGAVIHFKGYYLPEVIVGNTLAAVGLGLITTFTTETDLVRVLGYQVIMGFGRGLVMQLFTTAIQANVSRQDAPIASAFVVLNQFLGAALFTSVAKTVFVSSIGPALHRNVPSLASDKLIDSGVQDIAQVVPAELVHGTLVAFNEALVNVFYLQLAAALVAFVTGWGMGWKSLKGLKEQQKETEKGKDEGASIGDVGILAQKSAKS